MVKVQLAELGGSERVERRHINPLCRAVVHSRLYKEGVEWPFHNVDSYNEPVVEELDY